MAPRNDVISLPFGRGFNIVKQQVTGRGYPTLRDTLIQPMEAALNQPTFLTQAQALLGKAISEHTTQRSTEVM